MSVAERERASLALADMLQLCVSLLQPPTPAVRRDLELDPDDVRDLARAAGVPALEEPWRELLAEAQATSPATWLEEHARLFEGPLACPVNETAYVRRYKGALLGDVAGFYAAFGVAAGGDVGEKLDHLAIELQFVALLLAQLVRARVEERREEEQVTLDALRAFAAEHLGEWLPGFCARLAAVAGLPHYSALAGLLPRLWAAVCERHGLPLSTHKVLLSVEEDPGTPYECGMADHGLS